MTSVSYPFKVGTPNADKTIPRLDVEFRYNSRAARLLERACNGNIDQVLGRGKSVEASVLLVCYGLLHADPKMTEDKAADLLDEFIDAGGDVVDLTVTLYKALSASGVYGKPAKVDDRPLETAPAAA